MLTMVCQKTSMYESHRKLFQKLENAGIRVQSLDLEDGRMQCVKA